MPRQTNKNIPSTPFDNQSNSGKLVRTPKRTGASMPNPSRNRNSNRTQKNLDMPFMPSPSQSNDMCDSNFATMDIANTKTSKTSFSKTKKKTKIAPQKTLKQKQKKSKAPKKEKDGTLFQQLRFFIQTHGIGEIFQIFCEWFDDRYYISIAIAVLGIIIGTLFNRYISIGFAFALVLFGILLSRKELSKGEYSCYISGAIVFIVPYLF